MPTTRLAAIMFTDIVGYTAMMQRNQAEAMAAVKGYESVLKTRIQAHGGELLQTYGDGSLSIFDSASAAVLCAKEIQEEIKDQVPLRIGIHLGEITSDGEHTFGNGVNIASRIESMGIPGAILFSQTVREQIRNQPIFQLHFLGRFSFKNVEDPMEIFALANEGLPIPKRSEMQGKFKTFSPSYLKWLVLLVIIGLIGILVLQASYFSLPEKEGRSEEIKELSIAVLPFKDLSPAGDQEYFSDGISEELLNLLTKVNNLKVASRTSSFVFKQQDRNIQDIAKLLEVEYVLEGSVRKAEDQIRITVQLIDTKTDRHIWSENYDRKLEDIFALQDELAGAIVKEVNQLVGNDTKQELPRLEISTSNLDAYDLLLRAMNLPGEEDDRKADVRIELAKKATVLDPEYIDAWYTLSAFYISRSNWVFDGKEEIDSLLNQADEALQEVIKINPADKDIPNLKAWLAFSRYELDSTYQLLTTYSEELESSFAQQILAQTYLAVGYLEESTQQYNLLIEEFNPNLPFPWATAGLAYCAYGEYEKAEAHFIRARELGYLQFLEYQLIDVYQQLNRPASIRLMAANWPFDSDSDSLQALIPYRADVLVADSNHKAAALERFWVVARELGLEQHVKSMRGREMNVYFESGLPNFDVQNQPSLQLGWVWAPYLTNYRKTEAFKAYIREANVLAFWQKHGFPPQCRDLGNGDFVCD